MVLYYEPHPVAYTHANMFGNRHSSHPGTAYGFNTFQVPSGNQYDFSAYPTSQVFTSDHLQSQHQNPASYFYDYRSGATGTMDDHWNFGATSSCNLSMSSTGGSSQLASPPYRQSPASNSSSMGGDTYGQTSPVPCGLFPASQNYFSASGQLGSHTSPVSPANVSSVSGNGSSGQSLIGNSPRNSEKVTIKSEPVSPAKCAKYDWLAMGNKSSFQSHNHQSAPVSGKTRTKDKYRVVYSDHQRIELEREFTRHKYIDVKRKTELARALLLSERQVKIWFQNRRAKDRKQGKKQPVAASRSGAQIPAPSMNGGMTFRNSSMQPQHMQCRQQYDHMKMEN